MQIIIDIPEETYKATCDGCMLPPDVGNVVQGIKNGIPLQKRHGKIIDESQITEVYTQTTKKRYVNWIMIVPRIEIIGTNAPAIIEAYNESEGI